MGMPELIVQAVVVEGRTKNAAATDYRVSGRLVNTWFSAISLKATPGYGHAPP